MEDCVYDAWSCMLNLYLIFPALQSDLPCSLSALSGLMSRVLLCALQACSRSVVSCKGGFQPRSSAV